MKFTKLQKEEILHKIEVRQESIEDDPESGTEYENTEGALDFLASKIRTDRMDVEFEEIEWLKAELENSEDICLSNYKSIGIGVMGAANSMRNAINKL